MAERRPAVRGGPGSLARGSALQPGDAFPARRNEADAGLSEGLGILPGARPPAFCPLGSAEPASPCFHSLRRRRPLVSPPSRSQAAGRARSGAGSLCPAVRGGCHLSAPRCGRRRRRRSRRGPGGCAAAAPSRSGARGAAHRSQAASAIPPKASSSASLSVSPGLRRRQPPAGPAPSPLRGAADLSAAGALP